jgi:hypothetical protein
MLALEKMKCIINKCESKVNPKEESKEIIFFFYGKGRNNFFNSTKQKVGSLKRLIKLMKLY